MNIEHTNPEKNGAFTAAELMRELANVSGEKLDVVAPGLEPASAVDSAFEVSEYGSTSNETKSVSEHEIIEAMGYLDDVTEYISDLSDIRSTESLTTRMKDRAAFDELASRVSFEVTPELIQELLTRPSQLLVSVKGIYDYPNLIIGTYVSLLISKLPSNERQDNPIYPLELEIPPELSPDGNGLNGLGMHLSGGREVHILGDAGDCVGMCMERGTTLLVSGDVGKSAGYTMKGGNLTIDGNAGNLLGNWMANGSIIVKGNSANFTGNSMQNGEIRVQGNAASYTGYLMISGTLIVDGDSGDGAARMQAGGYINIKGDAGPDLAEGMLGGQIHVYGKIAGIHETAYGKKGKITTGHHPDIVVLMENGVKVE
jgi:formylmethanofuran dehydrogenase subunit C